MTQKQANFNMTLYIRAILVILPRMEFVFVLLVTFVCSFTATPAIAFQIHTKVFIAALTRRLTRRESTQSVPRGSVHRLTSLRERAQALH